MTIGVAEEERLTPVVAYGDALSFWEYAHSLAMKQKCSLHGNISVHRQFTTVAGSRGSYQRWIGA
jgi:hypothetical protein